jgi:cupin 2 domain-containing protein
VPANLFDLPNLPETELSEPLWQNPHLRVERIISTGQTTPIGQWYDQSTDEWVVLLQGTAKLMAEDGQITSLKAGDYLLLPAHHKHCVVYTSIDPPCIWLAIHAEPA